MRAYTFHEWDRWQRMGSDTHKIMYTTTDDWMDWMNYSDEILLFVYFLFICLAFHGAEN
jgi:hypothetical protein